MATHERRGTVAGLVVALVVIAVAPAVSAQPDPGAVARARRVADKRQIAKEVVEQVLQVGATFTRKAFKGVRVLEDASRQPTRYFALDYRYRWDSDGWTDVAYICNETGLLTGLQVLDWRSEGNEAPFANANANVAVFGAALLKLAATDPKFTSDDRAVVGELINARDAQKLLTVYLTVAQRAEEAGRSASSDRPVVTVAAAPDR